LPNLLEHLVFSNYINPLIDNILPNSLIYLKIGDNIIIDEKQ